MTRPTKTILICDDDQGMRDTLTAILKRDYRVLTGSSGGAALGLLKNEDVDLILQDIRLPGISGFDVLRIIKENYSLVECIMISAINEVETAVQAMKHGAYHYITKDFDYDELRSLVRHACARAAGRRAQRRGAAGFEPAGDHAQCAGRRAGRARVSHRSQPADPRHRGSR